MLITGHQRTSSSGLLACELIEQTSTTEDKIKMNAKSHTSTTIIHTHRHNSNTHGITRLLPIFLIIILSQFISYSLAEIVIASSANQTTEASFDNDELQFGSLPFEGTVGKIILANPEDACTSLSPPPNKEAYWFLLANKHSCTLKTKVKNAAEAGYKAIIIFSVDLNSDFAHQVSQKARLINIYIPALMISNNDGELIKSNYLYDKGYVAMILPRIPFPLNAYLLPFAIVIIVCLFLMVSFLIFQIIKCVRDRRRMLRHRLTTRQLRQLLTTVYTKGCQYDTCAICLDEYLEGEKLRVLPCGHGYHLRCIDPWLTKSRRICPVCKGKVRVSGMSDISDTESESDQTTLPPPRPPRFSQSDASESTPLLRGG